MHDVARRCDMNYVRSKDAQKQLARTSLSHGKRNLTDLKVDLGKEKTFVYTMTYDKFSKITRSVEAILVQARQKLKLSNRVIIRGCCLNCGGY